MKIDVLGVAFDSLTPDQAARRGGQLLRAPGFHYAVTPNPEFLLTAEKDDEFRCVLNGADLVLPDGVGVVYSAKLLGTPLKGRVTGVDFAAAMLAELAGMGGRLFLLGSKPGVAEAAAAAMTKRYPGLTVCGTHDGYFTEEQNAAVLDGIRAAAPDLLFVCLGAPRQEKWIARFGPQTGAHLAVGLGGVLDVWAGTARRAPRVFQKLGLEWAYRLVREPKRAGRMARLPLVLVKAAGRRLTGGGRKGGAG